MIDTYKISKALVQDERVSDDLPLGSQGETPFDEEPDWSWSIDAEQQGDAASLWTVKITVSRPGPKDTKIQASLAQMVFDPQQRGSTLDVVAAAAAAKQANSSSNTANSSSQSSSSGTNSTQKTTGGTTKKGS